MLRLRKSPDTAFVVEKALNERNRPELSGLETALGPKDLDRFAEINGSVDIVLQTPQ